MLRMTFCHPLFIFPALLLFFSAGLYVRNEIKDFESGQAIRATLADEAPNLTASLQDASWNLFLELEAYTDKSQTSEQIKVALQKLDVVREQGKSIKDYLAKNPEMAKRHEKSLGLIISAVEKIDRFEPQLSKEPPPTEAEAEAMIDVLGSAITSIMRFDDAINLEHRNEVQDMLRIMKQGEKNFGYLSLFILLTGLMMIVFLYRNAHVYKTKAEALQSAERANALYAAALRSTRVGVFIRDRLRPDQPVVFVNDAFQNITGYSLEDGGKLKYAFLAGWHTDKATLENINETIKKGESNTFNALFYRKDGSAFWSEMFVSPVKDKYGIVTHYVFLLADITEQRQMQEALIQAKEQAERASAVKTNFLAVMSHEIRTPMNGLLGVLNLLADTPLDEEQRKLAAIALSSSQSLHRIINDILDFVKIEAGKIDILNEPFFLRILVNEMMDLVRPSAAVKNLDLKLKVQDSVPSAFISDAGRIRQILLNLVTNAVKFTEEGSIEVRVFDLMTNIVEGKPLSLVRFEVVDTGIGISAADQDKLFKEFSQVERFYTRRYGGAGLGLAIAERLVKLLDGEIGVESKPGKGSKFWFVLPLTMAPEGTMVIQAGKIAQDDERPPPVTKGKEAKRILLVEDNDTNQLVTCRYLQKAGFNPDTASSGDEAIMKAEAGEYDLVLMDISMPGIDGLEATRRIRALGGWAAEVPVIALTAHVMPGDHERSLAAGMNDHLNKPIEYQELVRSLEYWLHVAVQPEGGPSAPRDAAGGPIPDIDPAIIQTLADDLGVDAMMRITQVFLGELDRHLSSLVGQEERPALEIIERNAHTLKSSSANCGLKRFATLMASLEMAARDKDRKRVISLLREIESAYMDGRQALIRERERFST